MSLIMLAVTTGFGFHTVTGTVILDMAGSYNSFRL